jgi:hypothetical protein
VSALSLLASLTAYATDPVPESWRVWLEPRFMHQPVSAAIPGAERTEFAAGSLSAGELQPFTKAQFSGLAQKWDDFAAKARANSAADLAQITPVYVRNKKKIIEYAELHSEKPIVPSAVLAPEFRVLFDQTMGPAVLLVVPNRNTAFVFPKLASNYADFAPMVLRAYRETAHPVSLEVFELSQAGIKAIGAYPDPARD